MPSHAKASIDDMEWLDAETCVVVWSLLSLDERGETLQTPPIVAVVTVEFSPADPSVGYMSAQWDAFGDAPDSILDRVAEEAADRAIERFEERESAYDEDRDDYRYADEAYFAGGDL